MVQYLAESVHFKITSEYESVNLTFKTQEKAPVVIGDFWGNPESAVISSDEQFVALGGCGIIIYFLREPYHPYTCAGDSEDQYFELYREKNIRKWVNGLHQDGVDQGIQFVRFITSNEVGDLRVFRLNVQTKDVIELKSDEM